MRNTLFVRSQLPAALSMRKTALKTMPVLAHTVRLESTSASDASNSADTARAPIPIRYPYFVARAGVNGANFPVYTDIRNTRSRWLTQIRKVDGDAIALCRDLFAEFGWGDPFDKLNPNGNLLVRVSQQAGPKSIVLRGNWSRDVKKWLEERGF